MTYVLGIDPGSTKSGWVLLKDGVPVNSGWDENPVVLNICLDLLRKGITLVIEDVSHYGMAVGRDVFDTVKWMGRFWQANSGYAEFIGRPAIKTHLCGVATAKDGNVRQALIDRYGGDAVAIGGKKCQRCKGKGWVGRGRPACPDCATVVTWTEGDRKLQKVVWGYETPPGPLHGISGHCWSALAVAVTWLDQQR